MKIVRDSVAGTLESSDLLVRVAPAETLEIVLKSEVIHQFGRRIEQVVRKTLGKLGVTKARVLIEDKGALDCVIQARVQAAVLRAVEDWRDDWRALA